MPRADSQTYGPTNFTEYLAALRARADVAASPTLSNSEVLALVKDEHIKQHEMAVAYQYIGDDSNGDPVWRLGTQILLQDITAQLAANTVSGYIKKIPGAEASYSANPSIGPH